MGRSIAILQMPLSRDMDRIFFAQCPISRSLLGLLLMDFLTVNDYHM